MKKIIITVIFFLAIAVFGIHTGNAAESLKECGDDPMSINIGDIIDCGIVGIGDNWNFYFYASEGDKIRITMTDMTSGSPNPVLGLFDPDGVLLSQWYVNDSGKHGDYNLTKTGRYTIVVWENGDNQNLDFRIALQVIIPSPPEARELCHDRQLDGDIDPFADSDVFIFKGNNGDKIRITMTDMTSGSPNPVLGLFDPDGVLLSQWYVNDSGKHGDYNLTKTGRYTIVVWENGDNQKVTYRLSFNCILGECLECVDFSANPTRGSAPLTVSFTDQSTGSITSWEWDFGDGSTSTMQNPTHTYTDPGTYTVSLTVTGPEGSDTNTKADYIKAWSPAKAMPWIPLLLLEN